MGGWVVDAEPCSRSEEKRSEEKRLRGSNGVVGGASPAGKGGEVGCIATRRMGWMEKNVGLCPRVAAAGMGQGFRSSFFFFRSSDG